MKQGSSTPEFTVKDGKLIITCDLNVNGERSSSGKSMVLCSTRGNPQFVLPDGTTINIGVNIYKRA